MKMRHVVAATSAALISFGAFAGGGAQHSSTGASADPATVRQAQQRLMSEGINPGPVDGRLGQQTREGLKEFQQSRGLEPSGQLDSQTIAALGIDSDSSAAAGGTSPGASSPGAASPATAPSSPERSAEPASGG
jgi:peptidoglycan hydrolase-like protein with peptidoglycan-binding domain